MPVPMAPEPLCQAGVDRDAPPINRNSWRSRVETMTAGQKDALAPKVSAMTQRIPAISRLFIAGDFIDSLLAVVIAPEVEIAQAKPSAVDNGASARPRDLVNGVHRDSTFPPLTTGVIARRSGAATRPLSCYSRGLYQR